MIIAILYYGPKWSGAGVVLGRIGHGLEWLLAEMTRNPVHRPSDVMTYLRNHIAALFVPWHSIDTENDYTGHGIGGRTRVPKDSLSLITLNVKNMKHSPYGPTGRR